MSACPQCGGDVPPKPLGQVGEPKTYCSVRCRSAAQKKRERERNPWDRSDRECKRCRKTFTPRTSHHAYCSEHCQKEAANRLRFGEGTGVSNYYRWAFIEERGTWCQDCGVGGVGVTKGLEVHHLVPVAKGGTHKIENLVVLCATCHNARHREQQAPAPKETRSPEPNPYQRATQKVYKDA